MREVKRDRKGGRHSSICRQCRAPMRREGGGDAVGVPEEKSGTQENRGGMLVPTPEKVRTRDHPSGKAPVGEVAATSGRAIVILIDSQFIRKVENAGACALSAVSTGKTRLVFACIEKNTDGTSKAPLLDLI